MVFAFAELAWADAAVFTASDVVALAGGEEMVVMSEWPALEMLVAQEPGLATVKFRNLACEGDTVFEQFRQLNFPSWPEQLKKVGATLVIAQFGKMESLRGSAAIPEFVAAYEKLLKAFAEDGRRVLVLSPLPFGRVVGTQGGFSEKALLPEAKPRNEVLGLYVAAVRKLCEMHDWRFVDVFTSQSKHGIATRDGVHAVGCVYSGPLLTDFCAELNLKPPALPLLTQPLASLIREKNRFWFHHWRPQNWAFLRGDRTEQLFSRDFPDTNARRLVAETDQWLRLVTAKEDEIARMAASPAKP